MVKNTNWTLVFIVLGLAFVFAWTLKNAAEHKADCIRYCPKSSTCLC